MYEGKYTSEQKTHTRIVKTIDQPNPSMKKHYETQLLYPGITISSAKMFIYCLAFIRHIASINYLMPHLGVKH